MENLILSLRLTEMLGRACLTKFFFSDLCTCLTFQST